MENMLRKLKETLSESDFSAAIESMRRKIKKGTLNYNLYMFETAASELAKPEEEVVEINKEAEKVIENKAGNKNEDKENELTKTNESLDNIINFCEECCKSYEQEMILSQLEEENKQLMEGLLYDE